MIITGIDRQKAGESAEAVYEVMRMLRCDVTPKAWTLLTDVYEALRDAERRPTPTPTFQQYADGAD